MRAKNKFQVALLITSLVLLVTVACGVKSTVGPPAYTATPSGAASVVKSEILSERGGVVKNPAGVQVVIPPQALSYDQEISIQTMDFKSDQSLDFQPMGKMISLGAKQEIFNQPVTIKIPYDEKLLPSDRDEGEVHATFLFEGKWYPVRGELDTNQNIISVKAVHFSTWAPAIDPIHEVTIGLHASAVRCMETLKNGEDIPKTVGEAAQLVERRLEEWNVALKEAQVGYEVLNEATWAQLPREFAKEIVMQITEFGIETFFGAKALEVTILGVKAGYLPLIVPAMYLYDVSYKGGEFIAAALKLEVAAQNYQAAKAMEYMLLYPKAKTIPEEYVRGLIGICDQTLIPKTDDTSPACSWKKTLVGTWVSMNNDYITFEADGTGFGYPKGDKTMATPFEWTCLENGKFKNLTIGSEYRLEFPNNDTYIMNGDPWRRTTLK